MKKFGPEKIRSLIDGAENEIEFALLKAREGLDLESSDGKVRYLTLAAEILGSVRNSIAVDVYTSRLAEELGVEKNAITVRINQLKRRNAANSEKKKYETIQRDSMAKMGKLRLSNNTSVKAVKAQERIITLLFENPDFYPSVKERLTEKSFSIPSLEKIFKILSRRIEENESLDLTAFSSELSNDEISDFVRLSKQSESFSGTKKELFDCIEVLENEREEHEKNSIDISKMSDEEYAALFKKKK